MKERISAFVDGELEPSETLWLIERLESDPELRRAWNDYHRVGDALRGHVSPRISAAVSARLVAEPIVLARRMPFSVPGPSRWVLPAAASLAAIALVAWMALPLRAPVPSVAQVSPASAPARLGVDDYLLAHQRFSPSSAMQGVAPYVRTVSHEGGEQ